MPPSMPIPSAPKPEPTVNLQAYFERMLEERDRQYDLRFKASETAVTAALAAQEKATATALAAQEKATASAFAASEKAIDKSETQQTAYNQRSNEFRAALDDANKNNLPRTEADTRFRAMAEKIEAVNQVATVGRGALEKEIQGLRESRSAGEGKGAGANALWGYIVGGVGLLSAVIAIGFAILKP